MIDTNLPSALLRVNPKNLSAEHLVHQNTSALPAGKCRSLIQCHGTFLRTALYASLITAYFAVIARLAAKTGPLPLFMEGGVVELTQSACVLLSGLLLVLLSKTHPNFKGCLRIMALLALLAFIRELNNTEFYRRVFFFGASSWFLGGGAFCVAISIYRRCLVKELQVVLQQPAALLLLLGFMIVVGWAQVFAQQAILPVSELDRVVEEGIECAGYLLILFGTLELHLNLRSQNRLSYSAWSGRTEPRA